VTDSASSSRRTGAVTQSQAKRRTLLWQQFVVSAMVSATARIQALSLPSALRFGRRLGDIGYSLAKTKRKIADNNLRLAFGNQKSAADREKIIRGVFRHFGCSLVTFMRSPALSTDQFSQLVTVEGWEYMEQATLKGKGVIISTAHFGDWEVLGRWLAQVQKLKVTVVAKEPSGAELAAYLRQMREGAGFAVLNKGESARPLLRILQRGEVIALLPDQNSGDVFVPFFGIPSGTVAGPASLSLHTGAPLVPVFCLMQPDGKYQIVCQPPIPTNNTGDREADVRRIMTEVNSALEKMIRQYPDQWLWLHNRWKSAFEEKNRARAWADNESERETARLRWQGN
jgi:KDO2-lipid IV(A) lauroyltransferase